MTVNSIEAQGIIVKVGDGGSPTSLTSIPNVTNLSGPGGSASVIDVTNLLSTAKEKRMGLPDEGQFTFDLNLDPDNAQHQALRNARANRTKMEFAMQLTDTTPSTAGFFGYVTGFKVSAAVDGVVKVAVTVEIDGPVTWS